MLQNILIFQLIQNPISRYCNYYIIQYPYISIFLWDASERCPPGPSLGRRTWVANAGHHYSIIPFSSSLSVKIETLSKPSPDRSSRQYKLSAYHTWYCGIQTDGHCCVSVQKYSDKYLFINFISSMPFMTPHHLNDLFINLYRKVDVANKTILVIGSQNPWLEVVLLARSSLFCFVLIVL